VSSQSSSDGDSATPSSAAPSRGVTSPANSSADPSAAQKAPTGIAPNSSPGTLFAAEFLSTGLGNSAAQPADLGEEVVEADDGAAVEEQRGDDEDAKLPGKTLCSGLFRLIEAQ
jgi:hypothetical protein